MQHIVQGSCVMNTVRPEQRYRAAEVGSSNLRAISEAETDATRSMIACLRGCEEAVLVSVTDAIRLWVSRL